MLKIAFVSDVYQEKDFRTGGEKLNFLLIKTLVSKGYQIDLFCNKIVSNECSYINKVYKLSDFNNIKEKFDLTISEKAIAESDITYIHGHSYLYRQKMLYNKLTFFVYKLFNKKRHLKRLSEYKKIKENINKCKKVIVSSEILKQDMIENYGVLSSKIFIITPPIEKYEKKDRVTNNLFTFGISALGFVNKGGYLTLKAVKYLKKRGVKFKVKFIYPSKNKFVNFLIKLYGIKDFCEFLPIQKSMEEFYYSIDCLLMPSGIETFGMVATEALSTGCPVITGEHCGASIVIKNGKNGFLYQRNNAVKNLTKAMEKMLSLSKEDLIAMESFCISSVEEFYLEGFAKNIESLLY